MPFTTEAQAQIAAVYDSLRRHEPGKNKGNIL
jgi:hypothetical protein